MRTFGIKQTKRKSFYHKHNDNTDCTVNSCNNKSDVLYFQKYTHNFTDNDNLDQLPDQYLERHSSQIFVDPLTEHRYYATNL